MSHILEKATLRILNPDGTTVGSGLLIAPELVVTCAHVIMTAQSEPGQAISVADVHGKNGQIAQVLEKGWSPEDQNDIAFLQLSHPSPALFPVRLSSSQNRETRAYTSLGFPQDSSYAGDTPTGHLGGVIQSKITEREDLLQLQGTEIRKGMSGAAILDVQSNQVVGMICEFADHEGIRRAYAITTETIRKFAPMDISLTPPTGQDHAKTPTTLGNIPLSIRQIVLLGAVCGLGLMLFFIHVLFPQPSQSDIMIGDFNVAVAEFTVIGNPQEKDLGKSLAGNIFLHLNENLNEIAHGLNRDISDLKIQVWNPEQVGAIRGESQEQRTNAAGQLAKKIHADIIIYGRIDTTKSTWEVTPEFYLDSRSFYDAQEIIGQYAMGKPFSIPGQDNTVTRITLSDQMSTRTKVLSILSVGLSFYAANQFEHARAILQTAENMEGFGKEQGKEILYLLLGNVSAKLSEQSKSTQFSEAEQYYQKSLDIDPEYARARIGMGNTNYYKALVPFQLSLKPGDIDNNLIDTSIQWYQRALQARNIPALANVETKVHFGLGQCYLLMVYSGKEQWFDPAITEFQSVVQEYGNGKNIYVKELAAEAHARLGLIYALSGHPTTAIQEYEEAVKLLDEYPDRKNMYLERITKLREKLNK